MTTTLAKELLLSPISLPKPWIIRNVDGMPNKGGCITSYVDLEVKTGHDRSSWFGMPGTKQCFYLADLSEDEMILGYPWVSSLTMPLNWVDNQQNPTIFVMAHDLIRQVFDLSDGDEVYVCIGRMTPAQQLAEAVQDTTMVAWMDVVPKELHEFEHVFSEEAAQRFLEAKQWDHAIELLPDAPDTLDCKVYPLSQPEQIAQDMFLAEHLQKKYIWKSISPFASLFFFIKKKDGSYHAVQDYCRLNKWTKKNKYPLCYD